MAPLVDDAPICRSDGRSPANYVVSLGTNKHLMNCVKDYKIFNVCNSLGNFVCTRRPDMHHLQTNAVLRVIYCRHKLLI